MKKEYSRLSDHKLLTMGLRPLNSEPVDLLESDQVDDLPLIASGGFDNIMKIIFENEDGDLPNLLTVQVNENTPDSVRQFVNNVLSANITAFKSAPDDETAFEMICPRGCSLEAYSDYLKESISRYSNAYSKQSKIG